MVTLNLAELDNLLGFHLGYGRDHSAVYAMDERGEIYRILSLSWDSVNGHFVLCIEDDTEELQ